MLMMKYIRLNRKTSSWIQVFMIFLLSVFLLLSFCPVRKSLYSLVNENPNPIEDKTAGINKNALSASGQNKTRFECIAETNIFFRNIDFTAKPGFSFVSAILGLILLQTIFPILNGFFKVSISLLPDKHLKTAPLYIRNRTLLI